jgi:hypothetical protein
MAAVVAVSLVIATAVSTWQAVIARKALGDAETARKEAEADRDRAKTAEGKANTNLERAKEAEQRATTEAAIARAVNNFLQEDLLKQAKSEPQNYAGSKENVDMTVREALDRASAKVGDRFRDQPLVEAAIRTAIAEAYSSERRAAVKHLERAVQLRKVHLGPQHPETLHSSATASQRLHMAGSGCRCRWHL